LRLTRDQRERLRQISLRLTRGSGRRTALEQKSMVQLSKTEVAENAF
jgi:hypothetical protein